ncbi:MAG: PAS domain-containing protein, partial [Candidatus Cloacimonetes bacterium]|nr:PAS domain-containing protein [Candidatus Cloacimonadota bacterium]
MATSNYQNLLDNLYEGVYYVDTDKRIKYWSRGAERITGYKSSETIGKLCSDDIL